MIRAYAVIDSVMAINAPLKNNTLGEGNLFGESFRPENFSELYVIYTNYIWPTKLLQPFLDVKNSDILTEHFSINEGRFQKLKKDSDEGQSTLKELFELMKKRIEFLKQVKLNYPPEPLNACFSEGILSLKGKEICFNNRRNLQRDLLNTLYKNPSKIWFNDEIWEDWGETNLKKGTKKFYTASRAINLDIKSKTGIDNFLIADTKQVQINSKYI